MVDDPTDLGAIIVVAQALCLSIFNLSKGAENLPFLPMVIKLTCLFNLCASQRPFVFAIRIIMIILLF